MYAQINHEGDLELVNNLGINLGESPEEILTTLQDKKYLEEDIQYPDKLASDNQYHKQVRDIDSSTPARFNADGRRLYEASGCWKIAVFAVRLDTYPTPNQSQFLPRTNNKSFVENATRILSNFKNLPTSGEYFHRDCYDAAKNIVKILF